MNEIIIAIDPSINTLGWARFENNEFRKCGTLSVSADDRKDSLEARISNMLHYLSGVCLLSHDYRYTMLIEEPEMFAGAVSTAAVHNSSLKKLLMMVGALVAFGQARGYQVVLIPVTKWKGQLPKHVTMARMRDKYGPVFSTDHESDAMGIADYYITHRAILPYTS